MEIKLEKELMAEIRELADIEQIEIKLMASVFMNDLEKIKIDKSQSLKNSLEQQIVFYGRKPSEYNNEISAFIIQYEEQIEKIVKEYHTCYIAIINELQDSQCNQKIAIANMKISSDIGSSVKVEATLAKKSNYEIIIQECFRQLTECNQNAINKLNELFPSKDNQLIVSKLNIVQKIMNIFTGKNKVKQFVIDTTKEELNKLQAKVDLQVPIINDETIHNIAIIKDAEIQTQNIFKQMLKNQ